MSNADLQNKITENIADDFMYYVGSVGHVIVDRDLIERLAFPHNERTPLIPHKIKVYLNQSVKIYQ